MSNSVALLFKTLMNPLVDVQFKQIICKVRGRKVNLQFHFHRYGFLKSVKLKKGLFESPENEEVFSEVSFSLSVLAFPFINDLDRSVA